MTLQVEPAEYNFKLALLQKDLPRVMAIIESSNLVGQSVISYLRVHGYSAIALQFVEDPLSRFELALESGNWECAEEAAELVACPEVWESLAEQARRLGNHVLARRAYAKAGNHAQALFVAALCGDRAAMAPAEDGADEATRIQAAILTNDSLSLAKTLEDMGLHSLAYMAYRRAGVVGDRPPPVAGHELVPAGELAPVAAASVVDAAWPLSRPLCEIEVPPMACHPAADEAAAVSPLHMLAEAEGGWEMGDDVRLQHGADEAFDDFAGAADNPLMQSKVPALHLMAGSVASAKHLMQQQAGVTDFEPLQPLFDHFAQLQDYGALLNRFEDVQPLVTVADMCARLEEGLQLTTNGKFQDAIRAFEYVLHAALFTLTEDAAGVRALVDEAREYVTGLRMELKRKELLASASTAELEGSLAARVLELACYFTCCRLRPEHLVLAVRSAMTLAFKLKQLDLAAKMARRLVDLGAGDAITQQAQKVLAVAQRGGPPAPALDVHFDDHLDFDLDAARFAPLYPGSPAEACGLCGAAYGLQEKGLTCRVCRVATIGAACTGLQVSL